MNEDRIEGAAKKVVGQAQEVIGDLAANDRLEARGMLNQATGAVQGGIGKVRDKVLDIIDDAPGAAREAVDTGRDYYQRGAAAVTRTMGDNTALTLLVAGAAGAALSWLVFRRKGKPEE